MQCAWNSKGGKIHQHSTLYLSKQQSAQIGFYTIAACFLFEPLKMHKFQGYFPGLSRSWNFREKNPGLSSRRGNRGIMTRVRRGGGSNQCIYRCNGESETESSETSSSKSSCRASGGGRSRDVFLESSLITLANRFYTHSPTMTMKQRKGQAKITHRVLLSQCS